MTPFFRQLGLMFGRSLRRTLREPMWTLIGLFQPVLYLLLFAPLLQDVEVPGIAETNALNWFVPGLLVMIALFSTGYAGFGILDDLRAGVVERLRVTPANRATLMLGMILHDVMIFLLQSVLLVGVATLMGMRGDLPGLLILLALLALVGFMVASASYAITLIVRDQGALAAIVSTVTLPLLLLAGVLLPLVNAPAFMKTLSQLNPFAHLVDAGRSLVAGVTSDPAITLGFGVMAVLSVITLQWAVRTFRGATA